MRGSPVMHLNCSLFALDSRCFSAVRSLFLSSVCACDLSIDFSN